jgi:hypothetical protein
LLFQIFWQILKKINKTKKAADNIVFAKGGVEVIIELPDAFSRACFFVAQFFCSLVPRKKHSLRLVEIEPFG